MALPEHKLSESPNTRAIDIAGWIITASTAPISSMRECDWLSATLDMPLPEMTFGSNALTLKHRASGAKLAFSTLEALRCVVNGPLGDGDGGVKVGYADKWLQSRHAILLCTCARGRCSHSALPLPQDRSQFAVAAADHRRGESVRLDIHHDVLGAQSL